MRTFLPLNLQLFAGDDDMILPDDYQEAPPQAEGTPEGAQGTDGFTDPAAEDTTPAVGAENPEGTPTQQPQTVKIKFNHEEREIPLDEAAQLAQKGMVFDKALERARQEAAQQARDEVIAGMGMQWNGKPIKTEAEYKQAIEEQSLMKQYKDQDLPPELIQELVESRRDRQERQKEKEAKEQVDRQQASLNEFFAYFESVNERQYDPQKDYVPKEVWDAVEKGQTLKHAYMEYHNKELRNQLKIQSRNAANSVSAPVGSVTTGGVTGQEAEDPFLTGFNSI